MWRLVVCVAHEVADRNEVEGRYPTLIMNLLDACDQTTGRALRVGWVGTRQNMFVLMRTWHVEVQTSDRQSRAGAAGEWLL